jgi:uncharacterized protein YbjT (DUF2867 family)
MNGATGYLGRPLTSLALSRGHQVTAFVRRGSEPKVPAGATVVTGNAFSIEELAARLSSSDTLVHLIGTPRPSPAKAQPFRDIDLASIAAASSAAARARIDHIVYVSVAHPAPMMRAYIDVRVQGEAMVVASGIASTILRPWYVLGPGHWWPYALLPAYWLYEHIPSTREAALRLGLVTHRQMITALMRAIEDGPHGQRVLDVPAIRGATLV